jgi:hypothetical protein
MPKAQTQIEDRFAEIESGCDDRNPMKQTIKLSTIAIRSPIRDFCVSSIAARTVRRRERDFKWNIAKTEPPIEASPDSEN